MWMLATIENNMKVLIATSPPHVVEEVIEEK
jgi:hypothetical protein